MIKLNDKEYLTVKEFASIASVSEQAVYKQLKLNYFQPYSTKFNHRIFIDKQALYDIYGIDTGLKKFNEVEQPNSTTVNPAIDKLIDTLQRELADKNKQIEDLSNNLSDTLKALDQQQQLSALDRQKILELETNNQELTEELHKKKFLFWKRK